jgi:hypothetical protein
LVRKQEILDSVWQEASVTEGALTRSIGLLRKALEDDSREPRFIETVPTAGFRFIADVAEVNESVHSRVATANPTGFAIPPEPEPDKRLPLVKKNRWLSLSVLFGCAVLVIAAAGWQVQKRLHAARPIRSLAVLPLENLSGDPSQDYFADGMTDELITDAGASDSRSLRITSRTSVMQYKGVTSPI